ncbi:MAG: hypothetical protein CML56_08655 [Rhodobacteraceae bacterium]|nr:hypothetical protein [Paracoccaceae bacterium]
MKIGDCVSVDTELNGGWKWVGICTWTDGYKFEFLIDGEFDTWTLGDLETVDAEVISESR